LTGLVVHLPVLAGEVMDLLMPRRGGVYVDATVGLGGHAEEMLKRIKKDGTLIGLDRDAEALGAARARLAPYGKENRVILEQSKFSGLENTLAALGVAGADGLLFDLGVSMLQLKGAGRGFSFMEEEALDMRMDRSGDVPTAAEVVNTYPEEELERVFREYGEERNARRIARLVVSVRKERPIKTGAELAALVLRAHRGGWQRIHPATRVFQALRIEVNKEMAELAAGLQASKNVLKPGGRLAVLSYHSSEDRAVKQFLKKEKDEGAFLIITKKPLRPGPEELGLNPSARSAKLRAGQKL
jgi:16S rRNA (cytosine1402-N4)-methyltransferase